MTLVLSNAFKGVLLSSYVNIKYELAVKSLKEFIDNPSTEIIMSNVVTYLENESNQVKLLRKKASKGRKGFRIVQFKVFSDDNQINRFRNGQTVIWCTTFTCPLFQLFNPHLHLDNLDEPKEHAFQVLTVSKSHSHAKQINKL